MSGDSGLRSDASRHSVLTFMTQRVMFRCVKSRTSPAPERLIRRYENRKLYDVQARRYVTLDDLARLVAEGTEVRAVDLKTGEDITTVVLAQVVLEGIKQRTASIPHQVLSRIIRLGNGQGASVPEWLAPP